MKKASRTTGTAASMTTSTRMERDTMGELPVPSNAYYGVQTARAIENFPISSLRIPRANNARSRFSEAVLRNAPGGAGVVRRRLDQQADELGAGVERAAGRLSTAQGAERGGKAVISGITGPSGFMTRFKAESGRLYDDVQKLLPPDTKVPASATQQALADLTTPIQGKPATMPLRM